MDTKESLRHEIKVVLREATFWCQENKLDLAVERIEVILDREKVKAQLCTQTFEEQRSHNGIYQHR